MLVKGCGYSVFLSTQCFFQIHFMIQISTGYNVSIRSLFYTSHFSSTRVLTCNLSKLNIRVITISAKLRWSNRSKSTNRLILWPNQLLINFFDLNLKPDFNLSWWNWLFSVRNISKDQIWSKEIKKRLKLIERDHKVNERDLQWLKKSK